MTAIRAERTGIPVPRRGRAPNGWAFVLPAVLVLLALNIFPLIYSILLSFTHVNTSTGLSFGHVTFINWKILWHDQDFWGSVKFTVIFTVIAVPLEYLFGFCLALLLRQQIAGGGFFRVLFIVPMLLAPVTIGFMWRMMYDESNGPIDAILRGLHLGSPGWLSDNSLSVVSVVIMDIWEWTPLLFILLLAGMQGIGQEVFDAARIDGANAMQVVLRIIFPIVAPISVMAVFLRMIDCFQVFGQIFLLTGGGPGTATTSTTLFAFFQGFQTFDLSYGATISLALLVLVIVVSLLFLMIARRVTRRVET
ncbi:MAG TPA: sugar ABC transporter permease [Mycobacteriales bacterium]|jgi:multiple sugar transport system permease protein|nr:sugar ABC transporter permease [Mycobacteriales bacterium]